MSAGWRVWGACRALALRQRPGLRRRTETFWQTRGAPKFYSDDANGHPSKPSRTPEVTSAADINSRAESSTENAIKEESAVPVESPPFYLGRGLR